MITPGITFILRAPRFPNRTDHALVESNSVMGFVGQDGRVRLLPSSTSLSGGTEWDYGVYREYYENASVINDGTDIRHALTSTNPAEPLYDSIEVYVIGRRATPVANVGTQAELSAGNCTVSTQTNMAGDGQGLTQSRMNFCATSSGRCMDR